VDSTRQIIVETDVGEIKTVEVSVTNKVGQTLNVDLSILGLEGLVSVDKTKLALAARKSEKVKLTFSSDKEGVYTGKLIFTFGRYSKEALISFAVEKGELLGLSANVLNERRILQSGEDLDVLVKVSTSEKFKEQDVIFTYKIMDFEGNVVYSESETIFISLFE